MWTKDHKRGQEVARKLDAGAVNINDVFSNLFAAPLPHGGWKESGVGARLGGAHAIRKYCRVQVTTAPRIPTMKSELFWYPYSTRRVKVANPIVRMVAGRGFRQRFGLK